jgi:hypothetical protein
MGKILKHDAQWKPGTSGNPSGRPRGVRNKTTDEMRRLFTKFVEGNIDKLQKDFDALRPKDRLILIERFSKLVMPPPRHELQQLSDDDLDRLIKRIEAGKIRVA